MGISKADRSGRFTFEIKTWFLARPQFEETVAGASYISVAIAAYEEALKHVSEGTAVILCQGGRVLQKHPADLKIG